MCFMQTAEVASAEYFLKVFFVRKLKKLIENFYQITQLDVIIYKFFS